MLAQANEIVPNQTSYILSEEFNNAPTNIIAIMENKFNCNL